ncbi:MAG TPA: DUF4097 family beta strand repeat-containing protein [Rhodanobacteraceae bacterium]|nr:DUF4097 family beta strand repeat-containing protein [Rhodanobacteraceae bacterium]
MRLLLIALLLVPTLGAAAEHCEYRLPQDAAVPLDGTTTVVFDIGRHHLVLAAGAAGGPVVMQGAACASSVENLHLLKVTRTHEGDKLVIRARGGDEVASGWIGRNYANIDLTATIPAGVPVQVRAGSGKVSASGVQDIDVAADSGQVEIHAAGGLVKLSLGTGEARVEDVGRLAIGTLGAGTIRVRNVAGDVDVDHVEDGDLSLRDIHGNVVVNAVGSGEVDVDTVTGNLTVHSLDPDGDVNVDEVDGSVSVPKAE